MYDVIVVGGGPSGLTAALYTARRSLKTAIVSKDLGGQAATTSLIENYPGVKSVDGFALMTLFQEQAMEQGAEWITGEVNGIVKNEDDTFTVTYNDVSISARSIILAFGLTPRGIGVPGESELTGKGVVYSTGSYLNEMKDKVAMVVGGGNSAIESVNDLAAIASKVYLVHRRDRFRAEAVLVERMEAMDNVEQILNAQLKEVHGEGRVDSATVSVKTDNGEEDKTVDVDGVFVNVGFMSKTSFIKELVALNEKNEVIIEPDCTTSQSGVFAAGDITTANYKQVIVSAGDGCKAALACYAYLMEKDGVEVKIDQDWEVSSADHFIRT